MHAVVDFIRCIAEIERHGQRACLEDTKVYGQPFQTVHQQDGHLFALAKPPAEQQIGKAVGVLVKLPPGNLPPVAGRVGRLDQFIFLPGDAALLRVLGIDLYQRCILAKLAGIAAQQIGNGHEKRLLIIENKNAAALWLRRCNAAMQARLQPLRSQPHLIAIGAAVIIAVNAGEKQHG